MVLRNIKNVQLRSVVTFGEIKEGAGNMPIWGIQSPKMRLVNLPGKNEENLENQEQEKDVMALGKGYPSISPIYLIPE